MLSWVDVDVLKVGLPLSYWPSKPWVCLSHHFIRDLRLSSFVVPTTGRPIKLRASAKSDSIWVHCAHYLSPLFLKAHHDGPGLCTSSWARVSDSNRRCGRHRRACTHRSYCSSYRLSEHISWATRCLGWSYAKASEGDTDSWGGVCAVMCIHYKPSFEFSQCESYSTCLS